jgi:glycosyltransferase involved in cell wall biosynthesis
MKIMLVKDRNVLGSKFLAQFANSQQQLGHEVHIVCDTYKKEGSGVKLNKGVKFTNLNKKGKCFLTNIIKKYREKIKQLTPKRYAKFIKKEKPDVIICFFMSDLYNILHNHEYNIPVIMMHHKYPPTIIEKLENRSKKKQADYKKIFEKATAHQVLMKNFEKTLTDKYNIKKITTIPNEVVQIEDDMITNLDEDNKKIIYVGRISKPGKRQHYLIEAFAKIYKDFPDWTVEFWGMSKYPEYNAELNGLIKKYGLENNVFLKGYSNDINKVYRSASINAFPSAHEGFGLGLADGMAHGIPGIGFATTPGVNELITDGKNGFLVNSIDEFSLRLKELMENKELRIKLGKQAREDMKQFAPETVSKKWDKFLTEIVNEFKK